MEISRLEIKTARQKRAIEALLREESVSVGDLGAAIGALNPRQTIMELRHQGFRGIIQTRKFDVRDRDGEICYPGEYFILPEYKSVVEMVLKKHVAREGQNTKATCSNSHITKNKREEK